MAAPCTSPVEAPLGAPLGPARLSRPHRRRRLRRSRKRRAVVPLRRRGGDPQLPDRGERPLLRGRLQLLRARRTARLRPPATPRVLLARLPDRDALGVAADGALRSSASSPCACPRALDRVLSLAEVRRARGDRLLHVGGKRAALPRLLSGVRDARPARRGHHLLGVRGVRRDRGRVAVHLAPLLSLALPARRRDEPAVEARAHARGARHRGLRRLWEVRACLPHGDSRERGRGGDGGPVHAVLAVRRLVPHPRAPDVGVASPRTRASGPAAGPPGRGSARDPGDRRPGRSALAAALVQLDPRRGARADSHRRVGGREPGLSRSRQPLRRVPRARRRDRHRRLPEARGLARSRGGEGADHVRPHADGCRHHQGCAHGGVLRLPGGALRGSRPSGSKATTLWGWAWMPPRTDGAVPPGPSIAARVSERGVVVEVRDGLYLRLDAAGRWTAFGEGGVLFRRTVEGGVVRPRGTGIETLTDAEAACVEAWVVRRAGEVLELLAEALAARGRGGGADRRTRATPGRPRASGVREHPARDGAERREAFAAAYPEPVPILPPHRYRDLVVLPATGARITAARSVPSIGTGPSASSTMPAFQAHLEAVRELFGAALADREGIFLGSASALSIPDPTPRAAAGGGHPRVRCAPSGDRRLPRSGSNARSGRGDWAALVDAGLTEATLGLETGRSRPPARRGKERRSGSLRGAVADQKAGGLACP